MLPEFQRVQVHFALCSCLVMWTSPQRVKLYSWKLCVVWAQRLGVPLSEFRSRPRVLESIKRTKLIYRRSGKAGHPLEFQVMAWGAVISCCRADILNVWTPLRTTEIEHWKGHRVNRSTELCAKPHVTAKVNLIVGDVIQTQKSKEVKNPYHFSSSKMISVAVLSGVSMKIFMETRIYKFSSRLTR